MEEEISKPKASCDPGWNDPPLFSYDSHQSTGRPATLTKRISFTSLTSGDIAASPPKTGSVAGSPPRTGSVAGSPPRTGSVVGSPPRIGIVASSPPRAGSVCAPPPCPGPPPLAPTKSDLTGSQTVQDTEPSPSPQPISLPLLLENFNSSLKEIFSDENEKETNEIKRRLTMMETMWNENKFPNEVQLKLLHISEALKYGKLDEADSLQRGLMVDHTPLCRTWMAAIRLLINSKRSLSSN